MSSCGVRTRKFAWDAIWRSKVGRRERNTGGREDLLVVPAQALAPANRDSRRTEQRKSQTRQVTGVEPPLRCRLACCRWNKLDFDAAFCAIVRDLQEELPE